MLKALQDKIGILLYVDEDQNCLVYLHKLALIPYDFPRHSYFVLMSLCFLNALVLTIPRYTYGRWGVHPMPIELVEQYVLVKKIDQVPSLAR